MRLCPHGNTAKDYRRARNLRNDPSPIENKLWAVLRTAAKAQKLKFRRQQALHPYIADFACMEARLLVELDGDTHAVRKKYDEARDDKLQKMGFTVLRFTNDDVMKNVDGVTETIILQAVMLVQRNKEVSS
ncbi:MAG: endonuclease domain-containing protein [Bdellovibrionales bacterium]